MTESSGNRRGEGMVVQSQRFLTMEEFLGTFFSVLHGGSRKDGHTSRIFESLARDAETTRSLSLARRQYLLHAPCRGVFSISPMCSIVAYFMLFYPTVYMSDV